MSCALPGCDKPVFVEPNGRAHPFCSRTHAAEHSRAGMIVGQGQIQGPGPAQIQAGPRFILITPTMGPCAVPSAVDQIDPPICALPGCNKTVYSERGRSFDYCGKGHRDMHRDLQQNLALHPQQVPTSCCSLPGCNEPVAQGVDRSGRPFAYCGRSHAQAAMKGAIPNGAPAAGQGMLGVRLMPGGSGQQSPNVGGAPAPVRGSAQPGQPTCKLPSCQFPRKVAPNGTPFDYCSKTCARQDQRRNVDRVWSGSQGFELFVLNPQHCKYAGVVKQFTDVWTSSPKPRVVRVMQVRNPRQVYQEYEQYRDGLSVPKETRRFHGTRMECMFGADPQQKPCSSGTCAVCNICQTSFNLTLSGTHRGGNFGSGIYFSRHSQKSHNYNPDSQRTVGGSTTRIMFLCKVAEGNPHMSSKAFFSNANDHVKTLIRGLGPSGTFDSVVAESKDRGGPCEFHETIVYNQCAAIPSYVIVYEVP